MLSTVSAFGDNDIHKDVIKGVHNKVELKYGESLWRDARADQIVRPGTKVRTGALAKAELLYADGTITRVGSRTNLIVLDKDIRAVKIESGKVWFKVTKKSFGLRIYSPTAVAAITGTEGVAEFVPAGSEKDSNAFSRMLATSGRNFSLAEGTGTGDFGVGLVEGSATIFESVDANGNPTGNSQDVGAGQFIMFNGNTFNTLNLGSETIRDQNQDISGPDLNANNNSGNNNGNNNNSNNNNNNNNNNNANNSDNSNNNANNTNNNTNNNNNNGTPNDGSNTNNNGSPANEDLGTTNVSTENVGSTLNKDQDLNTSPTTGDLEIIIK